MQYFICHLKDMYVAFISDLLWPNEHGSAIIYVGCRFFGAYIQELV